MNLFTQAELNRSVERIRGVPTFGETLGPRIFKNKPDKLQAMIVKCGSKKHQVSFHPNGRIIFHDHSKEELDGERMLYGMEGTVCGCARLLFQWQQCIKSEGKFPTDFNIDRDEEGFVTFMLDKSKDTITLVSEAKALHCFRLANRLTDPVRIELMDRCTWMPYSSANRPKERGESLVEYWGRRGIYNALMKSNYPAVIQPLHIARFKKKVPPAIVITNVTGFLPYVAGGPVSCDYGGGSLGINNYEAPLIRVSLNLEQWVTNVGSKGLSLIDGMVLLDHDPRDNRVLAIRSEGGLILKRCTGWIRGEGKKRTIVWINPNKRSAWSY